ncbi:glycosyltransferase, partial [Candidatus Woesebacteria bacterium]|nr:glycosyltransferase [Candidatus Woesebacteria bacterium]
MKSNKQHYHNSNHGSNSNLPLVSILIPTYNRADYLGEAIDSALKQTYKNIKIIVHDDASTDSTPELLKKYSDKRLHIIRTEDNHGMLGGWNYIITKAKGEYIKFLASDDLLEPRCVEKLVKAAIKHPSASIITCQRKFIDGQGRVVKKMGFAKKDVVVDGREHAHWILTTLRENKIGEPTAVLYPTKLVKKAGDYDKTFSQFADFEYWIRLLEFGDLVYVHKPLCSFRTHAGSNTSAAIRDGRFITEIFALLKKYYDNTHFLKVFNLSDNDRVHVT